MRRFICRTLSVFIFFSLNVIAFAQTAQFSGRVTDPSQALVRDAEVRVVNQATGVERQVKTNGDGVYTVPFIVPGTYQIFVQANGFSTAVSEALTVTVGQALVFDVQLKVGGSTQEVKVEAGSQMVNTTDASVSTVVDRQFVENMPLNGRSLQSLISLSPGVVQTPIPYGSSSGQSGEFSINGQRTEANYYTVDGVGANLGIGSNGTYTAGPAGLVPNQTALGTTQTLTNVDALQEFRISTSTYSAEYGRTPGGQISLQTRSGTDEVHGNLFNYFRNDALDANNWFNDHTSPVTAKTAERQNDFGGTLGGPVLLPHVYDGRHRTFFFYSYEGLRLTLPTPSVITEVPDLTLRASTPTTLLPIVDSFPLPNGAEVPGAGGLAYLTAAYSLPSGLDSNSLKIDHSFGNNTNIFARYSGTTSSSDSRSSGDLAQLLPLTSVTRGVTVGLTRAFSNQLANDLRFNYSSSILDENDRIDSLDGAQPAGLSTFLPLAPHYSQFAAFIFTGDDPGVDLNISHIDQTQINLVDTQQFSFGHHLIKIVVRLLPVMAAKKEWTEYEPKPGFESWRINPGDPAFTEQTNWYRLRQYMIIDTATGKVETPIDGPYGISLAEEDKSLAVWTRDQGRLLLGNIALPFDNVDSEEQSRRKHLCAVAAVDLPSMNANCIVFTRDASDVILPENPKPERLQDASFGSNDDEVILHFSWHGRWAQSERYRYDGRRWNLAEVLQDDPVTGNPLSAPDNPKSAVNNVSLTIKQDLNNPPVLWATDSHLHASKPLWNPNPQLQTMVFGKAAQYHWKDNSGYEWTGILVTPPGYAPGRRYPLVIQTHGFMDYGFITDGIFPTAMAARPLASAGFVVLQMGWRIDHFATDREARDQIAGFRSAIAQLYADGIIDSKRVGIIGFSRTCWHVEQALIDQPDLFAVATIADGIDLSYLQYSLFGEGRPALRKEFEKIIGTRPDGNGLDSWVRQSPSFHLDKVTTPIRIEAIGQSSILMEWEIYAALRRENKPVDMIYLPGGQHILQKPLDRLASQQGNVDWFRFWLQGYEDPDPAKAEQYKRWEHLRELRDADTKTTASPSQTCQRTNARPQ
jgi:poly(3-hydroxybutyrate) depolymerase